VLSVENNPVNVVQVQQRLSALAQCAAGGGGVGLLMSGMRARFSQLLDPRQSALSAGGMKCGSRDLPLHNRNQTVNTTTIRRATAMLILAAGTASAFGAPAPATADTPWLLRLRAVQLDSANGDSTHLGLSINNKVIPEFDATYFFTPEWAAELVLTYPQKQTIRAGGNTIGSLKHLPPTLTLQYHCNSHGAFKPYVGAGVNYTRFSSVHFDAATEAALHPSLSKSSFGAAVQVGLDYDLTANTVLNLDIKKVQIRADVKSSGSKVGEFKVDPWLIGVGIGYRF